MVAPHRNHLEKVRSMGLRFVHSGDISGGEKDNAGQKRGEVAGALYLLHKVQESPHDPHKKGAGRGGGRA